RARAAGLVILERALGMAGFGLLFLIGYGASIRRAGTAPVFDVAALCIALSVAGIAAVVSAAPWLVRGAAAYLTAPRLSWIATMIQAGAGVPTARLALAFALSLLSVAVWLGYIAVFASGAGLGMPGLAMVTVVSEFSRLLPISIQGVG